MTSSPHGYFDYNATTPPASSALEAWSDSMASGWHNPSSLYRDAAAAKQRLEDLREDLADWLDCDEPERIIWTAGATEANNAVLRHFAVRGETVAVSAVEHPCVAAPAADWFPPDRLGVLPVDPATGAVDPGDAFRTIEHQRPALVSVMAANNETGALQPWREIAAICRDHEIPFHCDAAQWIGKLPSTGLSECDFLTGSAHKFGGPRGVGFLVVPNDFHDFHLATGGPQEGGRRAGTEDLAGVAALAAALANHDDASLGAQSAERAARRDRFEERIIESVGVRIPGRRGRRLWNTSLFILPREKNLKWLTRLDRLGFAVSTGSACSAGRGNPSAVMAAMGLDFEEMGRVLRVSGGWDTSDEEWQELAAALEEIDAAW